MFQKLYQNRQKFSYTSVGNNNPLLNPITLKLSIETTFGLLCKFVSNFQNIKIDQIHHEIFVKHQDYETTFCLAQDDQMNTLISVNTFSNKRKITYKKLIDTMLELRKYFERYTIKTVV